MEAVYTTMAAMLLLASAVNAVATPQFPGTGSILPYAPVPGACPGTKLVRQANGLGSSEQAWINKRKPIADAALKSWVSKFGSFPAANMPSVGSSVAGGFLRASMLGAGIHQQLDGNEGVGPMAGLLQSFQYEATLSGSVAYQLGLVQNNWPSIASLSNNIWQPRYAYGLTPGAPNMQAVADSEIVADVAAKTAASFPATLIDIYGRIISYASLYGNDGGVSTLMSDTRNQPKFANAQVPLPLWTSIGTHSNLTTCFPGPLGTQYEFTPFEFGSWDQGVSAFMDMKYLGTRMLNGNPVLPVCTTRFDNLGFGAGTTANVLGGHCVAPGIATGMTGLINGTIDAIAGIPTTGVNRVLYAAIPNPFAGLPYATSVANDAELELVDGGNSGQVIPLWPLIRRNIDVVFVWDNYYDLNNEFTTGGQIYNTYTTAQTLGIKNVPRIPSPQEVSQYGLNTRPYAYGCNTNNTATYIYVPYQAYIPPTQSTMNETTTPEQTRGIIENGNRLATYNGEQDWPQCVACLVMQKSASSLPSFCGACFTKYCHN